MPAVQWSSFTLFPCLHRPSFGWPRAHLRLAGKKLQESREQLPSSSYGLKQLLRPKCQASAMGSVKTLRLSSWCHSNYDASRACLHLLHSYCSTPTDQVEHTSAEIRPDIDRPSWSNRRVFTADAVRNFCQATGDFNPIHLDPDQAIRSGFLGAVVPGIFVASMFPAIIAAAYPGAVYLSQSLKFRYPAVVPAEIQATVTLMKTSRGFMTFTTSASQGLHVIVDGAALAKIPHERRS